MLLFSGVFFTLGYVMGRNQYDGQVRAATNLRGNHRTGLHAEGRSCDETCQEKICIRAESDTDTPSISD